MCPEVSIRDLSNFLLDYAVSLMAVGVHTSRVGRNAARIAETYGYRVDMTIFQRTITMSVIRDNDDTVRRTSVRKIRMQAINFQIISRLSALSWEVYDEHLPFRELCSRYEKIMAEPRYSRWAVLGLVACANAAFCRLFGGDLPAMGLVFIATAVAFWLRQELVKRQVDHMAVFIVCSFIASFIAAAGVRYHWGDTPQIALGTSVLFLIPGVPLINSIIDVLEGHVLVGFSRGVNACILIICIALGLSVTLLMLGINAL